MTAENSTNGIVIGVVESLDDPENLGRVQLRYPHLGGQRSDWARIATPMAGGGRGAFFRPERGDEVLVAFEHGDPRRPNVIGALWSKSALPPEGTGPKTENNIRLFVSRSKHTIVFDDTAGGEKIELMDKDGKRRVTIDSANNRIEVNCQQGDVQVFAQSGEVKIQALNVLVEAQNSLTLRCNGMTTITGNPVAIN